jgi:hypothetical protein
MIELDFFMDDADKRETHRFLADPNFPSELCENLEDWVPVGRIIFSVNNANMSCCRSIDERYPILEYATKLNQIVHSLQPGKFENLTFTLNSDRTTFFRIDEYNVQITRFAEKQVCGYVELLNASEQFCSRLYDAIIKEFPAYFKVVDRCMATLGMGLERVSERKINRLFLS